MMTSLRFDRRWLRGPGAIALLCATAIAPLAASTWDWNWRHRDRDTVWVVNRDQGTVMVFDAVTGDAVTEEPVLVGPGLHDIVVSPRTGTAFVTDDSSKVYVLSEAAELIATIPFAPGSRPHHLSATHDGKTIYAGLFGGNTVAAIDTRSHDVRFLPSSNLAGTTAHAPEPSRNGRFIFVPHEGQNLVTELSARREVVRREVTLGTGANSSPSEVLPTRDGETLFVAMRVEGKIRTIDLDTFTETGQPVSFDAGVQPESLILTPGERTLVVSLRGTAPARVAFIDTDTRTHEILELAGPGTFGDLAVASPDGRFVYATFDRLAGGQGGVAKIDVRRRAVVDTWLYPGTGRPHGIAYRRGKHRGR